MLSSQGDRWNEVLLLERFSMNRFLVATTPRKCASNEDVRLNVKWMILKLAGGIYRAPVVPRAANSRGLPRRVPLGVPADAVNWVRLCLKSAFPWTPDEAELAALVGKVDILVKLLRHSSPLLEDERDMVVTFSAAGHEATASVLPVPRRRRKKGPRKVHRTRSALRRQPKTTREPRGSEDDRPSCSGERSSHGDRSGRGDRSPCRRRRNRSTGKSSASESVHTREKRRHLRRFRSESQSDMSESPFIRWKRPSQRGHNVVPDMERQWIRHSMGFVTTDPWTQEEMADIAKGYPGAFCGHFLAMVFSRQRHGAEVTHTKLLREVSVTAWARRYISQVEPRDFQEVATLAFALDLVNANRVDSALDVIAQRILAVKRAQEDGGSWKTAEQMELVRSSSTGVLWFMVPPCGQGGVGLAGARG